MYHPIRKFILIASLFGAAFTAVENSFGLAIEHADEPSASSAIAYPAIQIPKDALTEKDFQRQMEKWVQRVMVKPALKRIAERQDAPWAKDAEEYLGKTVEFICSSRTSKAAQFPKNLHNAGEQLLKAKCDEPLVCLFAGIIAQNTGAPWSYVLDWALKAQKKWGETPETPAICVFYTENLIAWASLQRGNAKGREAAESKVLSAFQKMASDGSFAEDEAELFLRHMFGCGYTSVNNPEKLLSVPPDPKLPEWVQLNVIGYGEIQLAWKLRTGAWAADVTPEGWKGFYEHLGKAREALLKSWKLNPRSPVAAAQMIPVIMGAGPLEGETVRTWFDRAIAAQCDYQAAYESLKKAYLPRWSGNHQLMLAFGKACMDTQRYDTDIPSYFAQACNAVVLEMNDWRAFYRQPEIARPLMEQSEAWLKEPSRADEKYMRQSYLAVNAWLTADNTRAAKALEELGGPLHKDTLLKLDAHQVSEQDFRDEVAIGSSKIAADFAMAESLIKVCKNEEADLLLKKLTLDARGAVKEIIDSQLRTLEIEKKLATGEWTKLPTDNGLREWLSREGKWSAGEDGSLINKGSDTAGTIVHKARVGRNFEMRLEFTVNSKYNCCRGFGLAFGWHEGFYKPVNYAVYKQPGGHPAEAKFESNYNSFWPQKNPKISYQDTNTMLLQSLDGKLTFTVNGKPAFTDIQLAGMNFGTDEGRVGVGSLRWCGLNSTTIKNIEVRKLLVKAPK